METKMTQAVTHIVNQDWANARAFLNYRIVFRGVWIYIKMLYIKHSGSNAITALRGLVKKYPNKPMFINQANEKSWSYTEVLVTNQYRTCVKKNTLVSFFINAFITMLCYT